MAIVIVIIAIVSIINFIILITTTISPKLIIYKVLNIGSIAVIVCYDKRSKLRKKFFKDCCRSKQYKFQLRNPAVYPLSSSNKLVFAYIIKT